MLNAAPTCNRNSWERATAPLATFQPNDVATRCALQQARTKLRHVNKTTIASVGRSWAWTLMKFWFQLGNFKTILVL